MSTLHNGIRELLKFIGEDPDREGLKETPTRYLGALQEMLSGYKKDPAQLMKVFEVGYDEMVLVKDIDFVSMCEHHMLPFTGTATIGYIPNGKVIGLSKIARLLDVFAKRLQVQERLTNQVTEALDKYLDPLGSACTIRATHMCMSCRGVQKRNAVMVTSSLTGAFRLVPEARAEFLALGS